MSALYDVINSFHKELSGSDRNHPKSTQLRGVLQKRKINKTNTPTTLILIPGIKQSIHIGIQQRIAKQLAITTALFCTLATENAPLREIFIFITESYLRLCCPSDL